MPIDIKTQTRSGVGGIVSIPPSPDKRWVREFGPFVALPIPAEFVAYFEELCANGSVPTGTTAGAAPVTATDTEDVERAAELAELLSAARAEGYATWIDVGICLHNIDDGMLGAWCDFSKKGSTYDEGVCEEKWAGFTDGPLGFGSLVLWAKKDDPEGYAGLQRSWHQPVVTDDDSMATARTLLEGLGQDPDTLISVHDACVENGKLTLVAVCTDTNGMHGESVRQTLLLDLTSLHVTSTVDGTVLWQNYMHAKHAIDAKGDYDLATVHKDIKTGQLWGLRREDENRAIFSTHDQLSHIDMLNMNAPGGQVANVRLDGHKLTRVTAKNMAVLQSMYSSSVRRALTDQYGLGCWVNNVNGNQQINVFNGCAEDDGGDLTDQKMVDLLVVRDPEVKRRFVFSPRPEADGTNGMLVCDKQTNMWSRVHNTYIQGCIVDALRGVEGLSARDVKFIESKRGMADLRAVLSQKLLDPHHMHDNENFEARLGGNLDILACTNGVFDMSRSGYPFRPIMPEDMVSGRRCCGWAYDPVAAKAKRPELERFLEQVLPVPEERRIAVAYIATLMSGRRVAKRFMILTDKSGGNNGKSAFADLVRGFFGSYAKKKGKKLITRPAVERGGRNDHDAGTQHYKGVRLLIAEELKSQNILDEGLLKELTSPMPTMEGRKFGEGEDFNYAWTAGFLLIFNQNDCPQADPADTAFWARVMVVLFRAKFLLEADYLAAMEDGTGDEHVLPVDTQLAERFPDWYSALADLLREAYDPTGLVLFNIPESMRDWKNDVIATNNPVAEWLAEVLEFTGVKTDRVVFDRVMMTSMYNRFCSEVVLDKAMGMAPFKEMLKAHIVEKAAWKAEMNIKIPDGTFRNSRNVGVGIKLKEACGV